jgi:hypothetical protein
MFYERCQIPQFFVESYCPGNPPELVFTKLILKILNWISEIVIHCRVFIYYIFWRGIGLFIVCFTFWDNAEMPEKYRLMMDYEYQGKKLEIHKLK